jgi:hypothetical protein
MVTIEIKKNTALVLLGFAIILAGVFVINAAYTRSVPNPGHGGDNILVALKNGTEYNLQEVISGELVGGSSGLECNIKTSTASNIAEVCCNSDEIATSHGTYKTSTGKPEPVYRVRISAGLNHDLQCMQFDNAGDSYTKQVLCCKKA